MKRLIIILLVLFITHGAWAQVNINVPLPKSLRTVSTQSKDGKERKIKFQTGGNVGLQIGTFMGLQLQPKIAIVPIDQLAIGITATYVFRWNVPMKRISNIFGVSPYVEAYLINRQLVLHAEYEFVNFPVYQYDAYNNEVGRYRTSSHVLLVGGGYHKELSEHSSITTIVLLPVYQFNPDRINYYSAWYIPIVRVGYNYSF